MAFTSRLGRLDAIPSCHVTSPNCMSARSHRFPKLGVIHSDRLNGLISARILIISMLVEGLPRPLNVVTCGVSSGMFGINSLSKTV